jgi:ATP-dependent exoDNAse (exonuclease V) alpha subunit
MRVMITANNTKKCYFNGNLGTIKAFNKNSIRVILDNGRVVNVEYIMNKNNIIMPLEYGYAATVQKCQGMTFNRMNLIAMDLHNNETNNVFMEGQLYTALSRCVDLKKINLIGQPFKESDIKVNPYALRFQFNLYQCVS